jgi:hypothetical protein
MTDEMKTRVRACAEVARKHRLGAAGESLLEWAAFRAPTKAASRSAWAHLGLTLTQAFASEVRSRSGKTAAAPKTSGRRVSVAAARARLARAERKL